MVLIYVRCVQRLKCNSLDRYKNAELFCFRSKFYIFDKKKRKYFMSTFTRYIKRVHRFASLQPRIHMLTNQRYSLQHQIIWKLNQTNSLSSKQML